MGVGGGRCRRRGEDATTTASSVGGHGEFKVRVLRRHEGVDGLLVGIAEDVEAVVGFILGGDVEVYAEGAGGRVGRRERALGTLIVVPSESVMLVSRTENRLLLLGGLIIE